MLLFNKNNKFTIYLFLISFFSINYNNFENFYQSIKGKFIKLIKLTIFICKKKLKFLILIEFLVF